MSSSGTPVPITQTCKYLGLLDHRGLIPKYELDVGQAESLHVLTEYLTFFSPALLYTRGKFLDSYLVDYMIDLDEEVKFMYLTFQNPIFRGLNAGEDKAWNYALWAVEKPYWKSFSDFIGAITIANREKDYTFGYGRQSFLLPDPLYLSTRIFVAGQYPKVEIHTFGISGSNGKIYMRDKGDGIPAVVVSSIPDAEEVVFAKAYFSGENPLMRREEFTGNVMHEKLLRERNKKNENRT